MIVDSHVHLMPDRLARAIRRFFDDHHPVDFAYPLEPVEVLDSLYGAGVRVVWNLPYAHKAGVAAQINIDTASLTHNLDHDMGMVLGCTAHPDDPPHPDYVGRAVARYGARVIKLHCSVGNFPPDHPGLDHVYLTAADRCVPVVIHAGVAPTGRTAAGDLHPLGRALARHPQTTFVLAHTGHPNHRTALDLMHRYDNLWSDLTPVLDEHLPATADEIEAVADRLLFGSDAPNTTLRVEDVDAWLSSLGLQEQSLEAIRAGNAKRLIKLADDRNADSY